MEPATLNLIRALSPLVNAESFYGYEIMASHPDRSRRALIVHPRLHAAGTQARSAEAQLEEARGLMRAINLHVAEARAVHVRAIRPATYLGSGKVAELADCVKEKEIALAIVNAAITPVQQRNLEKEWGCKVIDRTALILEIFGDRARTAEGALQVELASLEYQKSRLVRSWTHLERQRGGFGFLGGPGERQIEADRRAIRDRIAAIRKQLETVTRTRGLHRAARVKVPYPVVALVGYTNAGKSTLFNRLTGAAVEARDALFATLDPTMRLVELPSGKKIILSDTVGFISDLPTELVAAFRATLEEVVEADLILHVRDISSPDSDAQKEDVLCVLNQLGLEEKMASAMIEVRNKADLVASHQPLVTSQPLTISAKTGEGCAALLAAVDDFFLAGERRVEMTLPASDGKTIAWLHDNGSRVHAEPEGDRMRVEAFLSEKNLARLKRLESVILLEIL